MLQLVLAIIVIGLAVAHFLRGPTETEGFADGAGTNTTPTFENDVDDPRDLQWLGSLSRADTTARAGHSCKPLTTEPGPAGTTIVNTAGSCEAGMPHTRPGDRIVIPAGAAGDRSEIIHHEFIHILQRRHADEWSKFYRRSWAFVFHPSPPTGLPADIRAAKRSNPDTWDPEMGGPWACWHGRFWPIPIYNDINAPTLRDSSTVWWDDMRQELLRVPPPSWTTFFGHPGQDEHPHEIAACMIVANNTTTEAGRRLMNWWQAQTFSVVL